MLPRWCSLHEAQVTQRERYSVVGRWVRRRTPWSAQISPESRDNAGVVSRRLSGAHPIRTICPVTALSVHIARRLVDSEARYVEQVQAPVLLLALALVLVRELELALVPVPVPVLVLVLHSHRQEVGLVATMDVPPTGRGWAKCRRGCTCFYLGSPPRHGGEDDVPSGRSR